MSSTLKDFIKKHTKIESPPLTPQIRLGLAEDFDSLWHSIKHSNGIVPDSPPFWGFAWPGGQAMARWLLDNGELIKGRTIIDFGSGSGIAAIAAKKVGAARVIAVDCDIMARVSTEYNAKINEVSIEVCDTLDHKVAIKSDMILAADMLYNTVSGLAVYEMLNRYSCEGVRVIMSNPDRVVIPNATFMDIAQYIIDDIKGFGWGDKRITYVRRLMGNLSDDDLDT